MEVLQGSSCLTFPPHKSGQRLPLEQFALLLDEHYTYNMIYFQELAYLHHPG